jgi:hypothetical protein
MPFEQLDAMGSGLMHAEHIGKGRSLALNPTTR